MPVCLCLLQMLPSQITPFLSNMFMDQSLFEKNDQVSLNKWSSTWTGRLHQLKVRMLLAVQRSSIGVALKKSGNLRPDAGQVMFEVQPLGKGSLVKYYYAGLCM